jgi:DNA invertase Pin-like site-specific DNA recombinase
MDRKRGAIYARISSDREGTGQKVDDQIADCLALAERLNLDVTPERIFRDDSITAFKGKRRRDGYLALLAAVRGGQVDAVLAVDADRIHRSSRELLDYIDACQVHDVPTYTVRGGHVDLSTPSGRMTAKIAADIAEHEVEKMIQRMREARVHKVERGEWTGNKRPFGYEADGVTVRDDEADALRWACSQVLAGNSLSAVAKELNRREVLTSTETEWDARTLRRVLLRPRNAGLSVHHGQVVGPAQWDAILPEALWLGVKALLEAPERQNNLGRPPTWLGTNLYVCGVCGALMITKARARPKMTLYVCSATAHLQRSAKEVDAYVEAVVVELLTRKRTQLLAPDLGPRVAELHGQDAAYRAREEQLGRAFATGDIDYPTMLAGQATIRSAREAITEQLAAAASGSVLADVADAPDPAKVWAGLDRSRKRRIIDVLMAVTILPAKRGRPVGWRPGDGSYFDPDTVRIEPKR